MKLTSRSEYALLALVYLGRHRDEGYIGTPVIAEAQQIPLRFLEQIMLVLKRAHLLRSVKGKGGGFQLARGPETITLAEVIRLLDGPLAPTESVSRYFYEKTPIAREAKLINLFREIRDFISARMEQATLAEML